MSIAAEFLVRGTIRHAYIHITVDMGNLKRAKLSITRVIYATYQTLRFYLYPRRYAELYLHEYGYQMHP